MGILEEGLARLGVDTARKPKDDLPGQDYPEGFRIQEILPNGQDNNKDGGLLVFSGRNMPHIPFEYGGSQRITKDHYPGSSEPVIHIMGADEDDVTIKGRLYVKHMPSPVDSRAKSQNYNRLPKEFEARTELLKNNGNLVQIRLGEWSRYGFISKTKFSLRKENDIDYEITFVVSGRQKPFNYQIVDLKKDIPITISETLKTQAAAFEATMTRFPASLPGTVGELIEGKINDVAEVVAGVTDFVDDLIASGEEIGASINRAIGLARYAQNKVRDYKQVVGGIDYEDDLAEMPFTDRYIAIRVIAASISDSFDIQAYLQSMKERFLLIALTVPLTRHRVNDGDSLQRIAMKYYANADQWKTIYDHNNLSSTILVTGTVLEIPEV